MMIVSVVLFFVLIACCVMGTILFINSYNIYGFDSVSRVWCGIAVLCWICFGVLIIAH